jgi:hypothetical protein
VALKVPDPRLVGVIMKERGVEALWTSVPVEAEKVSQPCVLVADQERTELISPVFVITISSDEVAVEEALAEKEKVVEVVIESVGIGAVDVTKAENSEVLLALSVRVAAIKYPTVVVVAIVVEKEAEPLPSVVIESDPK